MLPVAAQSVPALGRARVAAPLKLRHRPRGHTISQGIVLAGKSAGRRTFLDLRMLPVAARMVPALGRARVAAPLTAHGRVLPVLPVRDHHLAGAGELAVQEVGVKRSVLPRDSASIFRRGGRGRSGEEEQQQERALPRLSRVIMTCSHFTPPRRPRRTAMYHGS